MERTAEPELVHGTVNGYSLVVPPEWQKIPVRRGTDQAMKRLLDQIFARHSRDEIVQYRRQVERRLKDAVKQARTNAGVDLFLPLRSSEKDYFASFLISYAEFGRLDTPPARDVLGYVASTLDDAEQVELAGVQGMRTERAVAASPDRGVPHASRHVEYLLPVPGTADSWLVASFSTLGDGDPDSELSRLLCDLFDAMMLTFQWTYQEDEA